MCMLQICISKIGIPLWGDGEQPEIFAAQTELQSIQSPVWSLVSGKYPHLHKDLDYRMLKYIQWLYGNTYVEKGLSAGQILPHLKCWSIKPNLYSNLVLTGQGQNAKRRNFVCALTLFPCWLLMLMSQLQIALPQLLTTIWANHPKLPGSSSHAQTTA